MPSFSKKQIISGIRDLIILGIILIISKNFLMNFEKSNILYYIILLFIGFIGLYCLIKMIWAVIASLLILTTINYYFYNHSTKFQHLLLDVSALLNMFIYLYLLSITYDILSNINKSDILILVFKSIKFI
ncbi:MAG: hypothetical protein ACJATM_000960 [Alphaproteobacteria bacterium]|jgi:hypothetical protein